MDQPLPKKAKKLGLRVAAQILTELKASIGSPEFAGILYSARAPVSREMVQIVLADSRREKEHDVWGYTYTDLLQIKDPAGEALRLLRIFREGLPVSPSKK